MASPKGRKQILPDSHGTLSDEQLMLRFRDSLDPAWFEQLVERYWAHGFGVAMRFVNNRALAEDALQEAFLRVLRSVDRFNPEQSFKAWFYVILRNCCFDHTNREVRQRRMVDGIEEVTEDKSMPDRQLECVQRALDRLNVNERRVIELRVLHELPFAEISAALGCSIEAVRKRAQRALSKLRNHIQQKHAKKS